MLSQGPLPASLHGLIEYVAGVFFIAAPFLFGFESDTATAVSIVVGVAILIITATTAMGTGMVKLIPVGTHLVLDFILAGLLIASPFLFAFTDDSTATALFIILGVAHLLITIATRFSAERPARGS